MLAQGVNKILEKIASQSYFSLDVSIFTPVSPLNVNSGRALLARARRTKFAEQN